TLDRVARTGAGRLVELAQVRGDDPERAADAHRPIREGLLRGAEHIPDRFDRPVHRQYDAAARTPETGVARGRPPGPRLQSEHLDVFAPSTGVRARHVGHDVLDAPLAGVGSEGTDRAFDVLGPPLTDPV